MTSKETAIGKISWSGELTPETLITLPDGKKVELSKWITMTNGYALELLEGAKQTTRLQ